jgi:hypothetical protein
MASDGTGMSERAGTNRMRSDERFHGSHGFVVLDNGATLLIEHWVLTVVETISDAMHGTARFLAKDGLSIDALRFASSAAGHFDVDGEQLRFLGSLISVQREQDSYYCVCQGSGDLLRTQK